MSMTSSAVSPAMPLRSLAPPVYSAIARGQAYLVFSSYLIDRVPALLRSFFYDPWPLLQADSEKRRGGSGFVEKIQVFTLNRQVTENHPAYEICIGVSLRAVLLCLEDIENLPGTGRPDSFPTADMVEHLFEPADTMGLPQHPRVNRQGQNAPALALGLRQ